jgi:hypothetical protein
LFVLRQNVIPVPSCPGRQAPISLRASPRSARSAYLVMNEGTLCVITLAYARPARVPNALLQQRRALARHPTAVLFAQAWWHCHGADQGLAALPGHQRCAAASRRRSHPSWRAGGVGARQFSVPARPRSSFHAVRSKAKSCSANFVKCGYLRPDGNEQSSRIIQTHRVCPI